MAKSMQIRVRTDEVVTVEVGTKLYMHNCNHNRNGISDLMEITATKIGHKWVTFERGRTEFQFNSDGYENSNYLHNTLFKSQESYDDMIRSQKMQTELERVMREKRKSITVEQMREFAKILGVTLEEDSND